MKTTSFFSIGLFMAVFAVQAQNLKLPLHPIKQDNGFFKSYRYGDLRFSNPRKLHVVIMSLKDEEATRQYRRFQALNTIGDAALAGSVALIAVDAFTDNSQTGITPRRAGFLGLGAASMILKIVALGPLKKSIGRYNQVLAEKFDITFEELPNKQPFLGLSIKHQF